MRLLSAMYRLLNDDHGCPYCHATSDCHPACPTRACPECGGLGLVIDLDNPLGHDQFGGKPCPRGCSGPAT